MIESFVGDLTIDQYVADLKTSAAVERHLQIITEAAYRLGDDADTICPGPNWSRYRGLGNLLRHAYHRIEDEAVWETVKSDLPALKRDVQRALSTLQNTSS